MPLEAQVYLRIEGAVAGVYALWNHVRPLRERIDDKDSVTSIRSQYITPLNSFQHGNPLVQRSSTWCLEWSKSHEYGKSI
jgi:hypothetical protein